MIADPVVRNRGTIGGALCQADPSEDLSAVCAAVGAQLVIRSRTGERVLDMHAFSLGPYETAVGPAELLTEIRVPRRSGSAYAKVDRRVGDWAIAAAGAALDVRDGVITYAGLALTAVGGGLTVEHELVGAEPTPEAFQGGGAGRRPAVRPRDRPAGLEGVQAPHRRRPDRARPHARCGAGPTTEGGVRRCPPDGPWA